MDPNAARSDRSGPGPTKVHPEEIRMTERNEDLRHKLAINSTQSTHAVSSQGTRSRTHPPTLAVPSLPLPPRSQIFLSVPSSSPFLPAAEAPAGALRINLNQAKRVFAVLMADSAASDIADGPVLSLVNKRIRALRKKMNRILQMEESIAQGKTINKEQEEVLRSKPAVSALIDELEKLRQPLSSAVKEEVDLALQNHRILPDEQPQKAADSNHTVVEDLLNLLYFGSLFDVKSQNDFTSTILTRTHERGCCLTYDYVTDDATDLLGEKDLDLISRLGGLLITRPADSSLTHKNALQRCIEHAKLWLAKADHPIDSNADVTYAALREKLNKIMSSEYFITTPEMKAPVEVAAAAAGNYASFQVPVHGTIVPASVPVEVEGSVSPYQEKDEGTENFEAHESGDHQSDPEEELQKDDVEVENVAEVVSVQQEEVEPQVDAEHAQRDSEVKEQQYFPRRGGYQNQRGGRGGGGGRRGYSNGRGGRGGGRGGGYYNGRNQYYDQSGNYHPRNYYNRGRGGRGSGGGHFYDNHGSGDGHANHVADVGVGL